MRSYGLGARIIMGNTCRWALCSQKGSDELGEAVGACAKEKHPHLSRVQKRVVLLQPMNEGVTPVGREALPLETGSGEGSCGLGRVRMAGRGGELVGGGLGPPRGLASSRRHKMRQKNSGTK